MTEVKNCRIQPKKNIYKPLFHQIFKTSKQREHTIQRVLRKYYKLKTYSKPLHLILTWNFPYILNNDQSKYSKRCWNCTNERKSQKFACDSTKEPTKEGLICSVREEPNSVQPCQSPSSSRCKPGKTTPKNSGENPGCFRARWETLSGTRENHLKRAPKSLRAREVFGSFEKRTPGVHAWITCKRMLRTNQSKNHQKLPGPNHAARVNVSRNTFLSSRAERKHFLWRWNCRKNMKT